jgi:hypothetical protein
MAALIGHKKRFAGWQKRIPRKNRYLVEQVLLCIVPEFERHGFVWYADFADNKPQEIGANEIPLQKREGDEWPTVQITFLKGVWGPRFRIIFSALPEVCKNPVRNNIPRQEAITVYGPAYFYLERDIWNDGRDSDFGFNGILLLLPTPSTIIRLARYLINWRKFLDSEVHAALSLLPILFDIFDKGIPKEWLDKDLGKVAPHVAIGNSWKIHEQ